MAISFWIFLISFIKSQARYIAFVPLGAKAEWASTPSHSALKAVFPLWPVAIYINVGSPTIHIEGLNFSSFTKSINDLTPRHPTSSSYDKAK